MYMGQVDQPAPNECREPPTNRFNHKQDDTSNTPNSQTASQTNATSSSQPTSKPLANTQPQTLSFTPFPSHPTYRNITASLHATKVSRTTTAADPQSHTAKARRRKMYPLVHGVSSLSIAPSITRNFPERLDVGGLIELTNVHDRPKFGDNGLGKFYWRYLRSIIRQFNQNPKADADADADADAVADKGGPYSRFARLYSLSELSEEDGASRRRFKEELEEAKTQERMMRTAQHFRAILSGMQKISDALLAIGDDQVHKYHCARTREKQTVDEYNLWIINFVIAIFDELGDVALLYELSRLSFTTHPELHWLFALDAVLLTALLLCRVFFYRWTVKAHQTLFNRVTTEPQQTKPRKLGWFHHVRVFGSFMLDPKSVPLVLEGLYKTDLPPFKVGHTRAECQSNNDVYNCLQEGKRVYVERRQKWVTWTVLAEDLPGVCVQIAYDTFVEDDSSKAIFWISLLGAILSLISLWAPMVLQQRYHDIHEDDRIWRQEAKSKQPNEPLYTAIGPHKLLTHTFTLSDFGQSRDQLTLLGHLLNHPDLGKEHIRKASVLIRSVIYDSKKTIQTLLNVTVPLDGMSVPLKEFILRAPEANELMAAFASPPRARDAMVRFLFGRPPVPTVEDAQVLSIRCRVHRQSDGVSAIEIRLTDGTIFNAQSYPAPAPVDEGDVEREGDAFEVMDVFAPGEYIKSVRVYSRDFDRPDGIVFDVHDASGRVRLTGHINPNRVSRQQAGIADGDNFERDPARATRAYKPLSLVDEETLMYWPFHDVPKAVSKGEMHVVECPGSLNTDVADAQPSVCWVAPDGFQILGLMQGTRINQGVFSPDQVILHEGLPTGRPATKIARQVKIDVKPPNSARLKVVPGKRPGGDGRYCEDDMVTAQRLRVARRYGLLDAKQKWCDAHAFALSPHREDLPSHDATAAAAAAAADGAGDAAADVSVTLTA